LAVLLSLAFLMPWSSWNWITEALVVTVYFPLLVSLGAGSGLAMRMKKVCQFSGNISYPLYMTHYAAIWIFGHYFEQYKPGMDQLTYVIIAGVLFLIGVAYLAMVFYDIPVRKHLQKKREQKLVAAKV
ncbi:MAG: acyltransferase, partial [Bacteroidota bacterium]|nr:acyltransferase [Bacteroidota bacterium]